MEEDMRVAIQYFEEALTFDTTYALAYLGIVEAKALLAMGNTTKPQDTWPQVEEAISHVLRLDENIAEAHCYSAFKKMLNDYDWEGGEKILNKALALNSNMSSDFIHYIIAIMYTLTNRHEEAIKRVNTIQRINPNSRLFYAFKGWILMGGGRSEEAFRLNKDMTDIDSTLAFSYMVMAQSLITRGMYKEALEPLQYFISTSPEEADDIGILGYVYARLNRKEDAQKQLKKLDELAETGKYVTPFAKALVYVGLGDKKRAFDQFEECYEMRDGWYFFIFFDNFLNLDLHDEPEYMELVRKIGLDKYYN